MKLETVVKAPGRRHGPRDSFGRRRERRGRRSPGPHRRDPRRLAPRRAGGSPHPPAYGRRPLPRCGERDASRQRARPGVRPGALTRRPTAVDLSRGGGEGCLAAAGEAGCPAGSPHPPAYGRRPLPRCGRGMPRGSGRGRVSGREPSPAGLRPSTSPAVRERDASRQRARPGVRPGALTRRPTAVDLSRGAGEGCLAAAGEGGCPAGSPHPPAYGRRPLPRCGRGIFAGTPSASPAAGEGRARGSQSLSSLCEERTTAVGRRVRRSLAE